MDAVDQLDFGWLANVPSTLIYPLSTPTFPLHSPSSGDQYTDNDLSEPPSSGPDRRRFETSPDDEEHTITPDRVRSTTSASSRTTRASGVMRAR
jgi:hypothetical protein